MDEFSRILLYLWSIVKNSEKGLLMYVSDDTLAVTSSQSQNASTATNSQTENSSGFFSNMVTGFMEEHTNKLKALSKSMELQNAQSIQSFSYSYSEKTTYQFKANTSALMSNIQSYFSEYSASSFNSSFAILEQWLSAENETQKTLIDYLLENSKDKPKDTAGAVNELFGVQKEVQDLLTTISKSSLASSSNLIASSLTAIDMEVATFGAESVFGSLSMEVKLQNIQQYAVTSCDESDLLENGGDMIEFEGKYINVSIFVKFMDPVVLDMNGDGINLRSVEDGVIYDIKGDGSEVQTGFVQGDDALLFFDENGDGFCSSGKELFGDQEGDLNGFAEMAKYDENNDGVLNSKDSIYKDLKIWNDLNGDGKSQADEIRTIEAAGVKELGLGYEDISENNAGNKITQQGGFTRSDGTLGRMVDVEFQYTEYNIFDY